MPTFTPSKLSLPTTARRPDRSALRAWTPLLALATAFALPLATHAYSIKPPWRGDSLPHDAYMTTKGHNGYNCPDGAGGGCGIDLNGERHNGSQWTEMKTVSSGSPTPFTDYLAFGMQLYSPVDGEVIACWQNMPEEDLDGSAPDPCEDPVDPESKTLDLCASSGNHLMIRTFDGHLVYLAHLQQGSIAPGLCPFTDEVLLADDTQKVCGMANRTGIHNDSRIDLRSPFPGFPQVKKGDPIAKVGNSGGSTTPHLHIGAYSYAVDELGNPCLAGVPWEFSESWSQPSPAGGVVATDWDPLQADELPFDGTTRYAIWGDPLGPNVDELAVDVGSLPAVAVTPSGGVGVFKNASDELEAVGFTFDGLGAFDLGAPEPDTIAVADLDVARLNATDRHVIAAVADDDTDKLTIVPYFVETDADLIVGTRHVELTPGTTLVRATPSPTHNGIVVATRNSANKMTVINYKSTLAGTNISVDRLGSDASNDVISDLDVATVVAGRGLSQTTGAFKGVVTAERRTSNNTWWLRSWQINTSGTSLAEVGTAQQVLTIPGGSSIAVTDVDIAVTGSLGGREIIVTSAISGGNLRVQTWQITTAGALSPVEEYTGGGPLLQLSSTRSGLQDVVVGARFSGNLHTLLSFHVASDGKLRRVGTWDSDTLSSLAIAGRTAQNDLVAMFTEVLSGEVTLDHYVTNYSWAL